MTTEIGLLTQFYPDTTAKSEEVNNNFDDIKTACNAHFNEIGTQAHGLGTASLLDSADVQEKLVSGTNIKTINGDSVLGSGDLTVAGGTSAHSGLTGLSYASAGHTGFEPTVTKGNLYEMVSDALLIYSGTGAVIGAGTAIQVREGTTTVNGYISTTAYNIFNAKQEALVSGTNIKTINSGTILGSGNIDLQTSSANLTSIADLTYSSISFVKMSSSGTFSLDTATYEPTLTKGDITEVTSNVLAISNATNAVIGTGATIQVIEASSVANGYLSTTNFNIFDGKQDLLVSATNIKTINGDSILGSGDLSVTAVGSANTELDNLTTTAINASLVPGTAGIYNIGSGTYPWLHTYTGSIFMGHVVKSSDYTITDTDGYSVISCTAGGVDITLPAAANNTGRVITIIKRTSNNNSCGVVGTVSDVSNPQLDFNSESMTVMSTGSAWVLLHHYIPVVYYAPTITATNWTTVYSSFTFSKTLGGIWGTVFNICGSLSAATTSVLASVSGITFADPGSGFSQQVDVGNLSGSRLATGHATAATGNIQMSLVTGSSSSNWVCSGNVRLASKPTIVL